MSTIQLRHVNTPDDSLDNASDVVDQINRELNAWDDYLADLFEVETRWCDGHLTRGYYEVVIRDPRGDVIDYGPPGNVLEGWRAEVGLWLKNRGRDLEGHIGTNGQSTN